MKLRILLPFQIFAEIDQVVSMVAETHDGSFGLYPQRLDCVAALTPGILVYEGANGVEQYVAIDEGILVKTGQDVRVSVRRASGGSDLGLLHDLVAQEFLTLDEQERSVRSIVAKLESSFIRRFANFQHE